MRRLPFALLFTLACSPAAPKPADSATEDSGGGSDGGASGAAGPGYSYSGRSGEDSVAYTGQILRHLLISDMKSHLGGLTSRIDSGDLYPVDGEVAAELDFYFAFDSDTSGSVGLLYETDPATLQSVYDDVASGKDLVGKIAGNDPEGQHKDWSTDFAGWPAEGVTSPESLVRLWFAQIDAAAVARSNGDIPLGPDGAPVAEVFLTSEGQDLEQLLQKFLWGAVAFSQGTDDYLDDATPGAGLLSSHAELEEGEPYTPLEHAWDEAFGYFGASRDYCAGDDALVEDPGYADSWEEDGAIDLLTEVCWGHSTSAAKRDLGASAATDLSGEAWSAFLAGRQLIAEAEGELSPEQLAQLQAHRDEAVGAWEAAIAASTVHYINGVLQQMATFGSASYSFADHAKEWSEMKGFALSLQFNPRSPLADEDFLALHAAMGAAPVLPSATPDQVQAYRGSLIEARDLLGAAYGFDEANLGDSDGLNGW